MCYNLEMTVVWLLKKLKEIYIDHMMNSPSPPKKKNEKAMRELLLYETRNTNINWNLTVKNDESSFKIFY